MLYKYPKRHNWQNAWLGEEDTSGKMSQKIMVSEFFLKKKDISIIMKEFSEVRRGSGDPQILKIFSKSHEFHIISHRFFMFAPLYKKSLKVEWMEFWRNNFPFYLFYGYGERIADPLVSPQNTGSHLRSNGHCGGP